MKRKKDHQQKFFSRSGESESSTWNLLQRRKKEKKCIENFEQNIENDIIAIDYE